jgi:CRP-like cAMP-binding protein
VSVPPGGGNVTPQSMRLRLAEGSPEQHAIEAGEIDAYIDYSNSNVVLLPAARQALLAKAANANGLLAGLPGAERQRLLGDLEWVRLRFGEVLQQPGAPIRQVYFPVDCVVSLLAPAGERQALEVGLVGREGMVGISIALGTLNSTVRALVRAGGTALRMKAECLKAALPQCPRLQEGLHRCVDAELALARQTAACNGFHGIEARLARCLLMTGDRMLSAEFFLTQAFLAATLGVRRATVNEAAGPLQRRGLISYARGSIRILDRQGLQDAACRCYALRP